jgi:hypothetical protein
MTEMTVNKATELLNLYPFRTISTLPRDMFYTLTNDVFNLLDAFRATEAGLRLFVDTVADEERLDEISKLVGEIDSISDDVRPVVDVLIAARKRYADLVQRMAAVLEAPK